MPMAPARPCKEQRCPGLTRLPHGYCAEHAGKAQITPQLIAQTAQATGDTLLEAAGIGKEKLAKMIKDKQGKPGIIGAQRGA